MPPVSGITERLFQFAPLYMKEDWDNVGLLCGRWEAPVNRVLISLDPSMAALREAKEKNCSMLLTHHPILFGTVREVRDTDPTGKALLYAAENGIACVNLHTNLDCAPGGVNDLLAARLGLKDVFLPDPKGTDQQGRPYGYLRAGTVEECAPDRFAAMVKQRLNCRGVRFAPGGKPVRRVAVGGGACGSELPAVLASGCDTFVTADLKYHDFASAGEWGINLIDAGHFQTENPVCDLLAELLRRNFPELEVLISESHYDAIEFL